MRRLVGVTGAGPALMVSVESSFSMVMVEFTSKRLSVIVDLKHHIGVHVFNLESQSFKVTDGEEPRMILIYSARR